MKRKKCTDSISHLFTHKTLGQQARKKKNSHPLLPWKMFFFFSFLTETGFFLFIGKHSYLKKKKTYTQKYFSFSLYDIIFIIFHLFLYNLLLSFLSSLFKFLKKINKNKENKKEKENRPPLIHLYMYWKRYTKDFKKRIKLR